MLAQEMATTQTNESDELKAKLTEAEGIIDLLQRQVQIKDEELARLQVNLSGGGDLATKPSGAPAASATPAADASTTPALDDIATLAADDSATPAPAASATPAPAASATPAPAASATPAPAASATPAPDASATPAPDASATPAPTATPTPEAKTAVPVAVAPDSETALDALVPASLRNLVPGGALTIIGILGSLLALGIAALMRALSGRRVLGDRPAAGLAQTPVAEQASAADEFGDSLSETSPGDASFDPFSRTLEAPSEKLLADTSLDPLEEVNVYLAYERFDQAEALVREVIQQHPNEPKYKLRLLEIYYSANQPEAYENAAKELHLAVGENSALWESAVAMWNEMSPTHALLAPHAAPAAGDGAGQVGTSVEFVDLTAPSETPPHVPSNADDDTDLDFDLSDLSADSVLGDVLDSTSDQTDERHFLDLTATVEKLEQAGFLPEPQPANEPEHDMFDVSGDSIASAPFEPSLEITTDNVSLLDLSATGDIFGEHTSQPRAGSVAGLSATASGDGLGGEITGHDFLSLEFDTEEPSVGLQDPLAVADGRLDFDLDTLADDEDETLDFDLGGLEPTPITEATASVQTTMDITGAPEDEFSFDLELDDGSSYNFDDLAPALAAEAAAEQDLLLKNPLFDLHTTANQGGNADDAELEFDLALQDTSDFSGILVDETLEMPASAAMRFGQTPAESLEDLTRSMEASLEGFDFEQDEATDGDEFALDLSAAAEALGDDALDLDFDLDLAASDDTGKFSTEPDMALERTGMHFDRSSLLPTSADDNLLHSVAEDTENKLNLAKAYIELGEHAAARTMLEEVEKEGSSSQQEAARRLLGQIR
jgi:pilus assembly protein FimV